MNSLTLTSVLLLFNPYINITSQNSLQLLFCYYYLQIFLFICNLYNSPLYGSTPILSGYLLLRHPCTWEKTSIFWSCQYGSGDPCKEDVYLPWGSNLIWFGGLELHIHLLKGEPSINLNISNIGEVDQGQDIVEFIESNEV